MPTKREQKAATRRRILEQTARAIRATGIERVGISDLMGAIGLTHGGFYAHFPSKDALAAEALTIALAEQCDHLLAAADGGLQSLVDVYLSAAHRDQPERGCPVPAVAAEVARAAPSVRRAFTLAFTEYISRLAARLPGEDATARGTLALALLAGLCGTLLLSRAVDDPALADRVLAAGRTVWRRLLDSPSRGERSPSLPPVPET